MIARNSLLLAFFSLLSILLGVVRDRLLADYVGVGGVLDIYNAAFRIPDLLYGSVLAFISAGTVVPFLTREDTHHHIKDPRYKLSSLSVLFLMVMIIAGGLLAIFLPLLAPFIVPGFNQSQISEYIFATRVLLVQPVFIGLTLLVSCYAQLKNQFLLYGISPLLYSFGIIGGIVFGYKEYGLGGLLVGVVVGSILSFIVQSFALYGVKLSHVIGFFSFHHIKELAALALPRTGTNIVTQLRVIVFQSFATTLGPGALSAFLFAQKIGDAFVQVIQQSVTTASIPVLSREYTEGKKTIFEDTVKRYTLFLFFVSVFIALLVLPCGPFLVKILYGQTGVSAAPILFFLKGVLVGLPFQMVAGYLSISLYSAHDTRSVFASFLLSSLVSLCFLFLLPISPRAALIVSATLFWFVNSLLLFVFYSRKKFFHERS